MVNLSAPMGHVQLQNGEKLKETLSTYTVTFKAFYDGFFSHDDKTRLNTEFSLFFFYKPLLSVSFPGPPDN